MADRSFPAALEPGSTFVGRTRYVESPKNFYVVPLAYEIYDSTIAKHGGHIAMPMLEDIVVYKSEMHKKFIRGQIKYIDLENSQCTIFAIDYGSTEECVKVRDMLEAKYTTSDRRPLALHCELFMCEPKGETFDDAAKEAFMFYLGENENLRIRIKAVIDDKLTVEVRNSNPDDVATMLALTGYTCLGAASNMGRRIRHKKQITWKHRQLKEGETLNVRLQYAPCFSKLYVCTMDDYQDYLSKRRDFIDYCRSAKDIDNKNLVVGKAVGVKESLNDPFERAMILEVMDSGEQVKVRLVDWGREAIVPISRVKLIQTEMFSNAPVRAIYCSAINPEEFKEFLPKTLCVGYNYRITIKTLGFEFDNPHKVTLA